MGPKKYPDLKGGLIRGAYLKGEAKKGDTLLETSIHKKKRLNEQLKQCTEYMYCSNAHIYP